jgi:hypothetical protein
VKRGERLGEALEALGTEVSELEQATDQPRDDDLAGFRKRLQASREVGRLTDHDLLLSRALADQVADHNEPGRDADPGRERPAGGFEPRHRPDQGEPRPDGALGVVLVRAWPAEIGEHAVAHELGDVAFETRDLPDHDVLVGADQAAHVFGIKPRQESRGTGEIDEHNGQLTAFGFARNRRDLAWLGCAILGRLGIQRAIALSSRLRSPRLSPSSFRSALVRSRRTSPAMRFLAKASS